MVCLMGHHSVKRSLLTYMCALKKSNSLESKCPSGYLWVERGFFYLLFAGLSFLKVRSQTYFTLVIKNKNKVSTHLVSCLNVSLLKAHIP